MTTGNGQRDSGSGSRLDRIETALEVLIRQQAVTQQQVDANSRAIADLTVQVAEANNMAVNAIAGLVDVADDLIERFDALVVRVDENSGYIRGLQTENRRILDILQQRGEQNGQQ
ncbi:hypothetical protein [Gloeobacter kilaueensis]|uniref:Uncharacterized protein n=1 Tax=Gloeobacter kilaueensis (strain ATCC BAA-2537 / CCAP 1431/1 / ULC 316 / JS1) TaxID=1183438 RepID=U5QMB4_GLOK1|nr:hypothetical protein [Gloeobacter kilaueensis]AGY60056.1 hypothetical protein GKIL_3810 [Gloeobacter kilaueensis JS1]